MVEGGKDTISNVYYDIKSNIPVIIIDGSGRAADFLNRWLLRTKNLENDDKNREIVCGADELEIRNEKSSDSSKRQNNQPTSNSSSSDRLNLHVDSTSKKLQNMFDKKTIDQMKNDLKNTLSHSDSKDGDIEPLLLQVMYCLQPAVRSDITVFNLNSDSDLSETIFRSICRSRQKLSKRKENDRKESVEHKKRKSGAETNKNREHIESESRTQIIKKEQKVERTRLLGLAMDWDCIDAAKEFIFQSSLDNILNKTKAFENALTKNLPIFVYEFLELGINPAEIFFPKNEFFEGNFRYKKFIQTLYTYDDAVNHPKTHLKYFIGAKRSDSGRTIDTVEAINLALENLIGDYMHTLYFDTSDEEDQDRVEKGLMKDNVYSKRNKYNDDTENIKLLSSEERKEIAHDYIMRDLFLWSILMNYPDMAKVFLSHMKYRTCAALIATKIFKQYEQKATYGELKEGYTKSAAYFEQYAIDCINKCVNNDANEACQIVLQQNKLYGYVTCLQVAADAKDKLFIATPCCVEAMYNIWYDKLYPEQKRKRDQLALFVGVVSLGFLAPLLVRYRKLEQEPKKDDPTIHMFRSNGIDYCDPNFLEYSGPFPSKSSITRYKNKLLKFHQSLTAKCFNHVIFYLFFLLLFSYVLLFNFNPPTNKIPSIHWTEILTIMLISCMLIEEIQYFFSQDSLSWGGKLENYFSQLFKQMTFIGFLLFYIGLIVRFTYADSEEDFTAARIIMAFDLEIWWLRSLSFIMVIPFLGPHLVAIGKMLKDLGFFTSIIAVVMIGYGVASRSMVYYPIVNNFTTATGGFIDISFDGRSVFRQIIYPVYYLLYGEFGNELSNLNSNPNAGWSIATQVLLAIHMLFVNVLLTNLLIAMFSKRFDQVYEDTKNIWHSQQYIVTREYYTRSPFVPPISLIYDIYYLCRMLFFFIRQKCSDRPADYKAKVFKIIPKKASTIKQWYEFEDAATYDYAHDEVKALKTTSTKSTDESDLDNEEKQVQDDLIKLDSIIKEMEGELQKRSEKKEKT